MNRDKSPAYAYIARNYREPQTDDPVKRWLPHPEVARGICGALLANGFARQDLEDGLQQVYLKALEAFRRRDPPLKPPTDLAGMKALCRKIARDLAVDGVRQAEYRDQYNVGPCENPDEFTPLEYGAPRRDRIDTRRQLEVLVQLFREGRMPEHGLEILDAVASRRSYPKIAEELGIDKELVRWRMREMTRIFRERMAKLGMLPGMPPLRVIMSTPGAVQVLRKAA